MAQKILQENDPKKTKKDRKKDKKKKKKSSSSSDDSTGSESVNFLDDPSVAVWPEAQAYELERSGSA